MNEREVQTDGSPNFENDSVPSNHQPGQVIERAPVRVRADGTRVVDDELSPQPIVETPPVVPSEPPTPVVTAEPPTPVVASEPPTPVVASEPPPPVVASEPPTPISSRPASAVSVATIEPGSAAAMSTATPPQPQGVLVVDGFAGNAANETIQHPIAPESPFQPVSQPGWSTAGRPDYLQNRRRKGRGVTIGVIIAIVAIGLGVGAYFFVPAVIRTIAQGDQIAFQDASDDFTNELNAWQAKIAEISYENFATAKHLSDPVIARLEEDLGKMHKAATELDGEHRKTADQMIASADALAGSAKDVVDAMVIGRQAEITDAADALEKATNEYNATVERWNKLRGVTRPS